MPSFDIIPQRAVTCQAGRARSCSPARCRTDQTGGEARSRPRSGGERPRPGPGPKATAGEDPPAAATRATSRSEAAQRRIHTPLGPAGGRTPGRPHDAAGAGTRWTHRPLMRVHHGVGLHAHTPCAWRRVPRPHPALRADDPDFAATIVAAHRARTAHAPRPRLGSAHRARRLGARRSGGPGPARGRRRPGWWRTRESSARAGLAHGGARRHAAGVSAAGPGGAHGAHHTPLPGGDRRQPWGRQGKGARSLKCVHGGAWRRIARAPVAPFAGACPAHGVGSWTGHGHVAGVWGEGAGAGERAGGTRRFPSPVANREGGPAVWTAA